MNWFKLEVNKGKEGMYHYVGASEYSVEELLKRAEHGYFIKLENLLYADRGEKPAAFTALRLLFRSIQSRGA